jgi:translation initiation factor 2B subunit (eIF-2B alpha/beta/delta family)
MTIHPAIETVNDRIHRDVIGGAADIAKEVIQAIEGVVTDSRAADAPGLAAEIEAAVMAVLKVLPSFAPPLNALHRVMKQVEDSRAAGDDLVQLREAILGTIAQFKAFAEQALRNVAVYGAEAIRDGDTLFMYSMSSTVWRVIKAAHDQGKRVRVIVTESRPANEGMWTVERMIEYGIPVEVSIDAAIGMLIPRSDLVMVGADSVAASGEALCKVGTYPSALVAREHGVPFYIAADTLKFDSSTLLGLPFRVDPIPVDAVIKPGEYPGAVVSASLFDVTPPHLIKAIISEKGFINPAAAFAVIQDMPLSKTIFDRLPDWAHGRL